MTNTFCCDIPQHLLGYSFNNSFSSGFQVYLIINRLSNILFFISLHNKSHGVVSSSCVAMPGSSDKRLYTNQISLSGFSKLCSCHMGLPYLVGTMFSSLLHTFNIIPNKKFFNKFALHSVFTVTVQPLSSLKKSSNNAILRINSPNSSILV